MMPAPDAGFAARCAALCPGFVALPTPIRGRKSELLWGELHGAPVLAKRVAKPSAVWSWYLAREIALYRAFAATPMTVRVPRFVAAADDVLVVERLPGAPVATRRRPMVAWDGAAVRAAIALRECVAAWPGEPPDLPPGRAVERQLRERLLEDPAAPRAWIADGLARGGRRGLIAPDAAARLGAAIGDPPLAMSHGDLLLRNAIALPDGLALVDWECAGTYVRDWDLALLWTQLAPPARALLEDAHAAGPAFLALCGFALVREVRFARAFGRRGPVDELAAVVARVG